jgi:hypothetical protein
VLNDWGELPDAELLSEYYSIIQLHNNAALAGNQEGAWYWRRLYGLVEMCVRERNLTVHDIPLSPVPGE